MKENSKEKLERQLNENPELKELFNLQMKSITNNVRALTEPLTELTDNLNSQIEAFRLRTEEMRVSTTKQFNILESDYNAFVDQYLSYSIKMGIILPMDFNEFFSWIASCRYPDEPFGSLKIQDNDFKLFHEFKERKFNRTDWNENKEWLFLNNQSQGSNPDSKGSKHKKQGRPKAVIQDASHYLSNEKLLPFLKSKYSEIKPQVFNHLIRVLIDLNQLKPATKKEYKEAFGEALNVKQSQTNFDNSFILNPNTTIYTPIKIEISNFLGSIEI